MKTIEYYEKTIKFRDSIDFISQLNEIGKNGWILCATISKLDFNKSYAMCIFYKQI